MADLNKPLLYRCHHCDKLFFVGPPEEPIEYLWSECREHSKGVKSEDEKTNDEAIPATRESP